MAVTYEQFNYDYKVDGDFVEFLNDKSSPPGNMELVFIQSLGSPFIDGARVPVTGEIRMQSVCYFMRKGA